MPDVNVQFSCNHQTRAKLDRAAANAGLSRSAYLRRLCEEDSGAVGDAEYDTPANAIRKIMAGDVPVMESALDVQRISSAAEKIQTVRREDGQLLSRDAVSGALEDLAEIPMSGFGQEFQKGLENRHALRPGVLRPLFDEERNRCIQLFNAAERRLLG